VLVQVVAVVHKRPNDATAFTATLRSGAIYTTYEPDDVTNKPMVDAIVRWSEELKAMMKMDEVPYWWSVDCIEAETTDGHIVPSVNAGRKLVLSEINCSCLGLVADTSAEAAQKGLRFADMIADIVLA